jgi:UDP-N-acetyl-D-galactosamine dehydrogenase
MGAKYSDKQICVIGLGYVGMPLALTLARTYKTFGFDINAQRVDELKSGNDRNNEIDGSVLRSSGCHFTANLDDIRACNVFIVTVPTPVDENNNPDFTPLEAASKSVAKLLKKGDIVVYESTVYPGVTEGYCGPILASGSGMVCGKDFFLGYSPERINPGDTKHTVETIAKVVSGQTPEVTEFLAEMYGTVNNGNVFVARDIKTAEAAKAIENAQRDINVAFINEVTMILNKMGLSIYDVLAAANTKWNFLPFTPGLVGGHCISVDPFYLAECAKKMGHDPRVILSGRQINDAMGPYVADVIHANLTKVGTAKARILLLGFTFKENINDIRNTKVVDVYNTLKKLGHDVDIHDPFADEGEVRHEYGLSVLRTLPTDTKYDCVTALVCHDVYRQMPEISVVELLKDNGIVFDMKAMWKNKDFGQTVSYVTI